MRNRQYFWESTLALVITFVLSMLITGGCSTQHKLSKLQKNQTSATLALTRESEIPELEYHGLTSDTLKVRDDDGAEMIIMKAIKDDETGEMVANDVIDAATITARFRNVAERHGKVDLGFAIIVPASMQDSKWQIRLNPDMFVMGDSIRLDQVIITGKEYRNQQLKGYQQYNRFVSRIVSDTTRFINLWQLEIFLKRNIPQLYAFKNDYSYVSDEQFESIYGVNERQAVEHYTNKIARRLNSRRKARQQAMYNKYVKVPIVTEGIRLDTVIKKANGDFIYNYVQTINTRPGLRKVDVVLSGEIYEKSKKIYRIPQCDPLTFYISSLSAFSDNSTHYMTKVIERRVSASEQYHIDFEVGRSAIKPRLGDNAREMSRIKKSLAALIDNKAFDLDSVVVSATASPEGTYNSNRSLAQKRSISVSDYFKSYMKHYCDSVNASGYTIGLDGKKVNKAKQVKLTPRSIPENWEDLDKYVTEDEEMSNSEKLDYFDLGDRYTRNLDARESAMQKRGYYRHLKSDIYPRLRTVKFNFYLHRKGMVKDTVHTTVVDSAYMKGVAALEDMDYETALVYLRPYNDYNTALAYIALDRNASALAILEPMKRTAEVNYLLAILYSRTGRAQDAVDSYLKACRQEHAYVYRGNLDPEISYLIKTYGLNKNE